jgi:signal transduction histidine kinase
MNCYLVVIKIAPLITSLFLSGFSIRYARLKSWRNPLTGSFILIHILLLIWAGGDLIRIFLTDYYQKWVVVRLKCCGICFISFGWLLLCLNYVKSSFLTRRNLFLLLIPSVLSYGIILTNDWHHLYYTVDDGNFNQFGALFYLVTSIAYLYCTIGHGLLMSFAVKQPEYYWRQALWVITAGLIPITASFMFVTKVIYLDGFDYTPLSFNISSLIILVGILKCRILDIVPVALRKIVDQMKEVIVVIDNNDRIIEYNRAATVTFPELDRLKPGESLQVVLQLLQQQYKIGNHMDCNLMDVNRTPPGEIYLEQTGQWFCVHIQPICSQNWILGRIISLNDITEYKRLTEELHYKNNELTLLNQQLQEYAARAEELASVKERSRVVHAVHDTMGQTMTLLLTTLQLCKIQYQANPAEIAPKLDQALKFANMAAQQTRQALYGLAAHCCKPEKLSIILPELIAEFLNCDLNIQLRVVGDEYSISRDAAQHIRSICQEAITNVLRHAEAEYLTLQLKYMEDQLRLEINDDGLGCPDFKVGLGLRGMEQRVRLLDGRIDFIPHHNAGFTIVVELPQSQLLPEKEISAAPELV